MTDYAELRAALEAVKPGDGDAMLAYRLASGPTVIRALLAERDALREALETMVEMVEMNGFGRSYAMDVARAALAQGERHETV
ncbi:hypothetical protein H0A70_07835 [Alcaligenaceae bacterium]|nr:hypothetical protein [Alcaligenaceae bacterium]